MSGNAGSSTPGLDKLGYNFQHVAQMGSPDEAVDTLLTCLGIIFQCERIYIFQKNQEGNYDCTDEWVDDNSVSKKHLLQNLSEKTVQHYYNHFHQEGELVIRDIDQFSEKDYRLYKLLKAQNLHSLICGQLIYDDKDKGFMGIDNPATGKFDELRSLFGIINYYVSIQKHRQEVRRRIDDKHQQSQLDERRSKKSLYDRAAELREGEPVAVIYCEVAMQQAKHGEQMELGKRMLNYAEHVLSSVFGAYNVFELGNNELLIAYEESGEMDIYNIDYYMTMAERTLEMMNIHISKGIAKTMSFDNDFFELVNSANVRMLQSKREYRDLYIGKYHMQSPSVSFLDLIEIHTEEDDYRVLYSEYPSVEQREGKLTDILQDILPMVMRDDQEKFVEFWNVVVPEYANSTEDNPEPKTQSFRIFREKGIIVNVEVTVVRYRDNEGKTVLMCYTR